MEAMYWQYLLKKKTGRQVAWWYSVEGMESFSPGPPCPMEKRLICLRLRILYRTRTTIKWLSGQAVKPSVAISTSQRFRKFCAETFQVRKYWIVVRIKVISGRPFGLILTTMAFRILLLMQWKASCLPSTAKRMAKYGR